MVMRLCNVRGGKIFIGKDVNGNISRRKELRKQLDELRLFTSMEKDQLRLNKFASVALGDFFDNANPKADKQWKDFRKNIENTRLIDTPVPAKLQPLARGQYHRHCVVQNGNFPRYCQ
ncbi:hypothetical protein AGMMS50239_06000 [Bacteroidia bacterium]|nr:hypothetical protein AGMMS50239_06000 [Bacteroidia bacterium]